MLLVLMDLFDVIEFVAWVFIFRWCNLVKGCKIYNKTFVWKTVRELGMQD